MIQPRGPGTELKSLLFSWGLKEKRGCNCKRYANTMNLRGMQWCRENIDVIVRWMKHSAEDRHLPFSKIIARRFISKAMVRSEEMPNLDHVFDAVYCVNLDRRKDRWRSFKKGLPSDWPFRAIKRVSAIDGKMIPTPDWWSQGGGAWGCYRTHLNLIENALNTGKNSILLMEDDATFCKDFTQKASAFLEALPDDWGLVYLGGQHLFVHKNPPLKINDLVYRPYNVNRTHAFAIRGKMLKKIYRHLLRQDWQKGNHIDHHLGRLHQQRKDPIYTPAEWLVGQAEGKSNISGREAPERFWKPAAQVGQADPANAPFVVVLGIHSSGTSCLAGVLYRLGLYLGDKLVGYYGSDPEGDCGFEAVGLRDICEGAIPFPSVEFKWKRNKIWNQLKGFLNRARRTAREKSTIAAGKYPQLCRLGRQLLNICGDNLYLLTSDRPIEHSIASMKQRRTRKVRGVEAHQQWLNEGKEWLISQVPSDRVLRVNYYDLLKDPGTIVDGIGELLKSTDFEMPENGCKEIIRKWVDPKKQHVR